MPVVSLMNFKFRYLMPMTSDMYGYDSKLELHVFISLVLRMISAFVPQVSCFKLDIFLTLGIN